MFNKKAKEQKTTIKAIDTVQELEAFFSDNKVMQTSPTYLAALSLLSSELARFDYTFKNSVDILSMQAVGVGGAMLNGRHEKKRYIFECLLDTGKVAIVVYDKLYILPATAFTERRSKTDGRLLGLTLANGTNITLDRVILANLSDTYAGGFRDWLVDVIELENALLAGYKNAAKAGGLFNVWRVKGDVGEREIQILQSLLQIAKNKIHKGEIPVLPEAVEPVASVNGLDKLADAKDYIIRSIARTFQIPLLLLQERDGGSYSLAREERRAWYETSLRSFVELVRAALEDFAQRAYNAKASVEIDISDIDYLQNRQAWNTSEIVQLFTAGIISDTEARKLLGIAQDLQNMQGSKQKAVKKSAQQEDEEVWAWHAKTIQPLERFCTKELLAETKKAIEKVVTQEKSKAASDDVKSKLEQKVLVDAVNNAIEKVLNKFFPRAFQRALSLTITSDVYIKPDDLIDAVPDMVNETMQYIAPETAQRIGNKLTELLQSEQMYEAQDIIDELARAGMSPARAETIARTEINRACAYAHTKNAEAMQQVADDAGMVVLKRWSTAQDEKVRESHQRAGLEGWIKADAKFSNGLSRPYEPGAAAGETVNCRCVLLTKIAKEEE